MQAQPVATVSRPKIFDTWSESRVVADSIRDVIRPDVDGAIRPESYGEVGYRVIYWTDDRKYLVLCEDGNLREVGAARGRVVRLDGGAQ